MCLLDRKYQDASKVLQSYDLRKKSSCTAICGLVDGRSGEGLQWPPSNPCKALSLQSLDNRKHAEYETRRVVTYLSRPFVLQRKASLELTLNTLISQIKGLPTKSANST